MNIKDSKLSPLALLSLLAVVFSGTITFNEIGDRASGDFEVWKVVEEDGVFSFERVKIISL